MSRGPIELLFWTKVEFGSSCWEWIAGKSERGYGRFAVNRKGRFAHSVAYELTIGPIPAGLELDHLCRNHGCVNPAHLEAVTHQENMRRGYFGSKTHCPQGHAYEGENILWNRHGRGRLCRACRDARMLAKYGGVGRGHGRKHTTTVCPRGHRLYVTPAGQKRCKVCKSAENLRYKEKRRARLVTA